MRLCDSTVERFASKLRLNEQSGCWEWDGKRYGVGYGAFGIPGVTSFAHRASYVFFVGDIPSGMCVCHRCDNPPCVNPNHLFLGTLADNARDCMAKGRNVRGSRATFSKLTEDDIPKILALFEAGATDTQISKKFGVAVCTIGAIRGGRLWKHITLGKVYGKSMGTAKLTDSDVKEVYNLIQSGVPGAQIAKQYGVSHSAVCDIAAGRSYHKITGVPYATSHKGRKSWESRKAKK